MVYGIWTFVAALVAFIISAVAGAFLIPMLRKLHFGQTILEDGPIRKNRVLRLWAALCLL